MHCKKYTNVDCQKALQIQLCWWRRTNVVGQFLFGIFFGRNGRIAQNACKMEQNREELERIFIKKERNPEGTEKKNGNKISTIYKQFSSELTDIIQSALEKADELSLCHLLRLKSELFKQMRLKIFGHSMKRPNCENTAVATQTIVENREQITEWMLSDLLHFFPHRHRTIKYFRQVSTRNVIDEMHRTWRKLTELVGIRGALMLHLVFYDKLCVIGPSGQNVFTLMYEEYFEKYELHNGNKNAELKMKTNFLYGLIEDCRSYQESFWHLEKMIRESIDFNNKINKFGNIMQIIADVQDMESGGCGMTNSTMMLWEDAPDNNGTLLYHSLTICIKKAVSGYSDKFLITALDKLKALEEKTKQQMLKCVSRLAKQQQQGQRRDELLGKLHFDKIVRLIEDDAVSGLFGKVLSEQKELLHELMNSDEIAKLVNLYEKNNNYFSTSEDIISSDEDNFYEAIKEDFKTENYDKKYKKKLPNVEEKNVANNCSINLTKTPGVKAVESERNAGDVKAKPQKSTKTLPKYGKNEMATNSQKSTKTLLKYVKNEEMIYTNDCTILLRKLGIHKFKDTFNDQLIESLYRMHFEVFIRAIHAKLEFIKFCNEIHEDNNFEQFQETWTNFEDTELNKFGDTQFVLDKLFFVLNELDQFAFYASKNKCFFLKKMLTMQNLDATLFLKYNQAPLIYERFQSDIIRSGREIRAKQLERSTKMYQFISLHAIKSDKYIAIANLRKRINNIVTICKINGDSLVSMLKNLLDAKKIDWISGKVKLIKIEHIDMNIDLSLVPIPGHYLVQKNRCLESDEIVKETQFESAIYSLAGLRTAKYLVLNVPNQQMFSSLLKAVKIWARNRLIYSGIFGYLNGAALSVMAAKICIVHPNAPINYLFQQFFMVFSKWDWPHVPVLLEELSPSSLNKLVRFWPPKFAENSMTVITPKFPEQNATFNVNTFTLDTIAEQLNIANQILSKNGKNWPSVFEVFKYREHFGHFAIIVCSTLLHDAYSKHCGYQITKIRQNLLKWANLAEVAKRLKTYHIIPQFEQKMLCNNLHLKKAVFCTLWLVGLTAKDEFNGNLGDDLLPIYQQFNKNLGGNLLPPNQHDHKMGIDEVFIQAVFSDLENLDTNIDNLLYKSNTSKNEC
uniref:polynucleotide adenylyltransferase n=1 Tax=Globodera rostochiensis TaxID=31243 RepID=A0A914I0X7_GLORO